MTSMWIGPDETLTVGQVGFLIEHSDPYAGWERHELRDLPAYTNQSHRPMLDGYCGAYNNRATYGRGMARVERLARNGRAFVKILDGDELAAALEALGYPELAS